MRTKKILSIVLAAMIAIGVFGVIGATASTAEIEPQSAAALVGWPTAVNLVNDNALAPYWDAATITWTGFAGTIVDNVAQNNSFAQQRGVNPPTASVAWTVFRVDDNGTLHGLTIAPNPAAGAMQPINIHRASTAAGEQLNIRQGTTPFFGTLEIRLTVTALPTTTPTPTEGVPQTGTIRVNLVDRSDFDDTIADARAILDNDNRYTDAFIRTLRNVVAAAEQARALDINAPNNAATIAGTQAALQAMIDDAPNHYRVWFIESALLGRIVWGIVDFFTRIADAVDPAIRLFTAFFGLFGFMMPLLSILLGLFII